MFVAELETIKAIKNSRFESEIVKFALVEGIQEIVAIDLMKANFVTSQSETSHQQSNDVKRLLRSFEIIFATNYSTKITNPETITEDQT